VPLRRVLPRRHWAEHLRQHESRLTGADRRLEEEEAQRYALGEPQVAHLFPPACAAVDQAVAAAGVSPDLVYRTDEQLVDRDVLGLGHGVEHGGGDRSTLSSKPGCAERSDSLNAFTANFVAAYAATGGERCAGDRRHLHDPPAAPARGSAAWVMYISPRTFLCTTRRQSSCPRPRPDRAA
jgi:hypothetical protein